MNESDAFEDSGSHSKHSGHHQRDRIPNGIRASGWFAAENISDE